MPTNSPEGVILGIDIGDSRIGVARAHSFARLPEPLTVIKVSDTYIQEIHNIAQKEAAVLLVIGLPVPLNGKSNEQTKHIREIAQTIHESTGLPFVFVDEAFSSQQADAYMHEHGNAHISNDAIASCIILERYFSEGEIKNA